LAVSESPNVTNPWVAKYIFPGGYIPALSEVLPAVERSGCLSLTSRSCGCTMPRRSKHWRARFLAHREQVERIYDARFVPHVGVLSGAAENGVSRAGHDGGQLQLAKRQGVVPMTRDYIIREAARLRARELGQRPPLATRRRMIGRPRAGATTSWVKRRIAMRPNSCLPSVSNGDSLDGDRRESVRGC